MSTIDLWVDKNYYLNIIKERSIKGKNNIMNKKFLSTTELALLLRISRQAVFKKIKAGEIKAQKIGRNFLIDKKDLDEILGAVLPEKQKQEIEKSVNKTVREYGETLKLLGRE
jgi:excisionase family DNA binding protein